jgi:hypothetical protein
MRRATLQVVLIGFFLLILSMLRMAADVMAQDGENISLLLPASCPSFPITVNNETELRDAVACYNAITSAGTYEINIAADIFVQDTNVLISNATAGVSLIINGNNFLVDGGSDTRVFRIEINTTVEMKALTITNGMATTSGSGIFNGGTLTLTNSTVRNNNILFGRGGARGGGISNGGTLTLINSTVRDNAISLNDNGSVGGGGISNSGTMTVINSTISHNTASKTGFNLGANGGGILNQGPLTIINSTISHNTASKLSDGVGDVSGGGIANYYTMTIINSTISNNTVFNVAGLARGGGISSGGTAQITFSTLYKNSASMNGSAGSGGGLFVDLGPVEIKNSIIAHSAAELGADCANIGGTLTPTGNNIGGDSSCIGFSLLNTDPVLSGLALNGGTTENHRPNAGSPAINGVTGDCSDIAGAAVTIDQRNFSRPQNVYCDIGSVEEPKTTGSITVRKVTGPAPYDSLGYDFQFYFNNFNFQLDTDEVAQDKPSSRVFADLQPGSYSIREASLNPNFYLKSVTCLDGDTVVLQHSNMLMAQYSLQVSVPLLQGQNLVCTFVNERRGDIQVRKFEDLNGNERYTNGEPWLAGWTFTLYQNGVQIGQTYTSNDNGKVNINNLIPGVYQICEMPQEGWNILECMSVMVTPLGRLKVDMPNTRALLLQEQSSDTPVVDDDGDGIASEADLCALGDDRIDTDTDGTADACDSTPTGDTDNDGVDNAVDLTNGDTDNDGIDNSVDVCALGDDRIDTDADGTADACDSTPTGDTDNDGVDNAVDLTPNGDTDNDGIDNSADVCALGDDRIDTDGDGTADACDSTPTDSTNGEGVDNTVDLTPSGDITNP